ARPHCARSSGSSMPRCLSPVLHNACLNYSVENLGPAKLARLMTAVSPILARRCLGSAAMVIKVSAASSAIPGGPADAARRRSAPKCRLDRRLQLLDLPGGVLGIEQQEVVPGVGQDRHVDVRSRGRPDDSST